MFIIEMQISVWILTLELQISGLCIQESSCIDQTIMVCNGIYVLLFHCDSACQGNIIEHCTLLQDFVKHLTKTKVVEKSSREVARMAWLEPLALTSLL